MSKIFRCVAGVLLVVATYVAAAQTGQDVATLKAKAESGDAKAQYNLGFMYDKGLGVPQDATQALHWYGKAAEQGHVNAQFHLGTLYEQGLGVAQDNALAASWYRKSAEQGLDHAQYRLSLMYLGGLGVSRDFMEAHKWAQIAYLGGFVPADEVRLQAEQQLTSAQIEKSRSMAKAWFKVYVDSVLAKAGG